MNQPTQPSNAARKSPSADAARLERKVGMGEIEVVSGEQVLKTLLGSCIGLVIHDQRLKVGGMAHVILPRSDGKSAPPGKYADTAVSELLRLIQLQGGRPRHLFAKLAGGSNMFSTNGPNRIGDQNLAAVEWHLKSLGIPVLGRHCGGNLGRRMTFFVETGRVTIEILGTPTIEL